MGSPGDVYDSPASAFVHGFIGKSIMLQVEVRDSAVHLNGRPLDLDSDGLAAGASTLFVRRHDMLIGPAGFGPLQGAVAHVRSFGPVQRAEIALTESATTIEIDAPATATSGSARRSGCGRAATGFSRVRAARDRGLPSPTRGEGAVCPRAGAENYPAFTIQPRLVCNNPASVTGMNDDARGRRPFVTLLLAGCAAEAPVVETPLDVCRHGRSRALGLCIRRRPPR